MIDNYVKIQAKIERLTGKRLSYGQLVDLLGAPPKRNKGVPRPERKFSAKVFASRLRHAMGERKLNQHALARALCESQSLISRWLTGEVIPRSDKIFYLSVVLNVPADWLIGLTDRMSDDED